MSCHCDTLLGALLSISDTVQKFQERVVLWWQNHTATFQILICKSNESEFEH